MALFTFNEKSNPTNDQKKYAALAPMVKRKALPDHTCAILLHIDMHASAITRQDSLTLTTTLSQLKFTTLSIIGPA